VRCAEFSPAVLPDEPKAGVNDKRFLGWQEVGFQRAQVRSLFAQCFQQDRTGGSGRCKLWWVSKFFENSSVTEDAVVDSAFANGVP
jgi:hypothetical protein